MTAELSTDEMLKELSIVFPKLWKRPLSEFGSAYLHMSGVWTGADGPHVMPDGDPIFNTLANGLEPPYAGGPVHEGFDAWLLNRGWSWENHDGAPRSGCCR